MAAKRHSDVMKERLQPIVDAITDEIEWDYQLNMLPAPNGNLMIVAVIMISMKNPLIGQPDLIHCGIIPDLQLTKDVEKLRETVFAAVAALREERGRLLGQEPVSAGAGGLIVPR